jgi:hypothetical protein
VSRARAAAVVFVLALLPGCAVWVESRYPARRAYDVDGRPVSSYYCYDCHGYRYFDPYYDWCVSYGFRYTWDRHPEAVAAYRAHYVRIKEQNPSYGRYRYRVDYRGARRYREPPDYDSWRSGAGSSSPPRGGEIKVREKARREPGSNRKKQRDQRGREKRPVEQPRGTRPTGGQRPAPPGGA